MGVFAFFGNQLEPYLVPDKPLVDVPRSLQDLIEFESISEDGIIKYNTNKYSKTYEISDINYTTASDDDKISILDDYCNILNGFEYPFKIIIVSKKRNMKELRDEVLMHFSNDELDYYRDAMNRHIMSKILEGKKGLEQKKYITVTIEANSFEEVSRHLETLNKNMEIKFNMINSSVRELKGNELLEVLRSFYQADKENTTKIDINSYRQQGIDFKNEICCQSYVEFTDIRDEYFKIGNKFIQGFYINKYPNMISDEFFEQLMKIPASNIICIDCVPIPDDKTDGLLHNIYMGIEDAISKQTDKKVSRGNFVSDVSYKLRQEKKDVEKIMNRFRNDDMRLFIAGINCITISDTKEEMKSSFQSFCSASSNISFKIARYEQRECFNTVLPIGCRQMGKHAYRTMITNSLMGFIPFNVQELHENGAVICYGNNQKSKEPIFGNRRNLINANGVIIAKSGSGKSVFAKNEMTQVLLSNEVEDTVLCIDPTLEYEELAKEFNGTAINISTYSENYMNPCEIDLKIFESEKELADYIKDESDLMLAICSKALGSEITPYHKAVVDMAVRALYNGIAKLPKEERYVPIFSDFQNCLLKLGSRDFTETTNIASRETIKEYSSDIALALDPYINGAYNIFNHHTNVDLNNRFMVFGIRDLPKEMYPIGMLIILNYLDKRIDKNQSLLKTTWLYIDELHEILGDDYTARYVEKCFKKHRKQGGIDTGITQNLRDITRSEATRNILSNCEFVCFLKQSKNDVEDALEKVEGMTEAMLKFVIKADKGKGVIKHGDIFIPFENEFDKSNPLYKLFNTNLKEKAEMAEMEKQKNNKNVF